MSRLITRFVPCVLASVAAAMQLSPAWAVTALSDDHWYVQTNLGDQGGVGRSAGSVYLGMYVDGAYQNVGSASGTVIQANNSDNIWILTAAHVVAEIGMVEEDSIEFPGIVDFSSDKNYYDGQFTIGKYQNGVDWYVPTGYDGTVVSPYDIALIRLDTSASIQGQGITTGDDMREFGEEYVTYGYGTTGLGATGNLDFDGNRRFGRNRFDIGYLDSDLASLDDRIILSDFDINPYDAWYDPAYELYYALYNDPNQASNNWRTDAERDYRIALESMITAGDSGSAAFVGDNIAAVTSFGQVTSDGTGGFFTFQGGFVRTAPWLDWIEAIITQYEAGDPITGLAGLGGQGVQIGGVDLEPILDEAGGTANSLAYNALVASYHSSASLSLLDKAKLLTLVPVTADTGDISDQEILEAVGMGEDMSAADAALLIEEMLQAFLGNRDPERQSYFVNLLRQGEVSPLDGQHRNDEDRVPVDLPSLIAGDTNVNDLVNLEDLQRLAAFWQEVGQNEDGVLIEWFQGDFNFDGAVNELDLALMQANYEGDFITDARNLGLIPEPASLALVGMGLMGLTIRRRRR